MEKSGNHHETVVERNAYDEAYDKAKDPSQREDFWREYAKELEWVKFPTVILDQSNPPFYRWFKDGLLNTCYNCVDRHAKDRPDQVALYWDSPVAKTKERYTYKELHNHVAKLASVMQAMGVQKGDRVIIYMPMIPQAVFAMLASARVGAIHSVVFGGFAAKELASRIKDADPKLVVTASCGIEPSHVVDYKKLLDDAIDQSHVQGLKALIVQRPLGRTDRIRAGLDFDYEEEMAKAEPLEECVPVESTHPLYILYTSGTTGQPKGIVRDNGGNAVGLTFTFKHIMGIGKGEVYFAGSDIGWVVGHSFIVYGPLLAGATTVLFEGKPVGTPDAGVYWRMVQEYQVNGLYTSPTALRAIRKEDHEGLKAKEYNVSSLKCISFAGERCDIPTFEWLQGLVPKGVLINDNYWQTETGWIISCNYQNLHTFDMIPGTATKPAPGFVIEILGEDLKPVERGELGFVCIRLPMPPSFMLTLYRSDDAFKAKYLSKAPGYYFTGDAGYFDSHGYLNIMTRVDDIINTAGHRLSTAQMEEVLLGHEDLVEAAVVAARDALKGEIPFGFVVVKAGRTPVPEFLEKELVQRVRTEIGPVAFFRHVIVVDKLPKTRSGKILRHILKKLLDAESFSIPPTIEDATVIDKIREKILERGFGRKVELTYDLEGPKENKDLGIDE